MKYKHTVKLDGKLYKPGEDVPEIAVQGVEPPANEPPAGEPDAEDAGKEPKAAKAAKGAKQEG